MNSESSQRFQRQLHSKAKRRKSVKQSKKLHPPILIHWYEGSLLGVPNILKLCFGIGSGHWNNPTCEILCCPYSNWNPYNFGNTKTKIDRQTVVKSNICCNCRGTNHISSKSSDPHKRMNTCWTRGSKNHIRTSKQCRGNPNPERWFRSFWLKKGMTTEDCPWYGIKARRILCKRNATLIVRELVVGG